ncbi:hypothetical protein DRN74_06500 [Candidatus Micrarchaeota archaeon]|nr:MAG: hypothetical protein DRN74_06500 [Candidatus Micrarchaeota archaeon]
MEELKVIRSQIEGMKAWVKTVDDIEELKRLLKGSIQEVEVALDRLQKRIERMLLRLRKN